MRCENDEIKNHKSNFLSTCANSLKLVPISTIIGIKTCPIVTRPPILSRKILFLRKVAVYKKISGTIDTHRHE